jgi:hypothetical protein
LVYEGLAHDPEKLTDFSGKVIRKNKKAAFLALPLPKYKPFRILSLLTGRAARLCCGARRR